MHMDIFFRDLAVARMIVAELAGFLGFLGLVAVGLRWEWNHLVDLWKKK